MGWPLSSSRHLERCRMSALKKPLASSPGSTSPAASETKKVFPSSTVRLSAIDLEYSLSLSQLEVRTQFPEPLQDEQAPVGGDDLLLFQPPGVLVRYEHGVEPGLQCRVDVGARRIADHPGTGGVELSL